MWDAETDEQRMKRPRKKRGGGVHGERPKARGDRRARGGKLSTEERDKMPKGEFAGPGRSFPVNDKKHARLAISGATRSERAGNISPSEDASIKAKARRKLGD